MSLFFDHCANVTDVWRRLRKRLAREADRNNDQDQTDRDFDNHLETGFQLATFQGPLCAEPMEGLAFFVENLEIDRQGLETEQGEPRKTLTVETGWLMSDTEHNRMAQVTGSFISSVRDACRNGLLDWSPRLMLAMYECDIQASSEHLHTQNLLVWCINTTHS